MEVISGVYRIWNVVTGQSYIGSSRHIYRRWAQHIGTLPRGKHLSPYLQRSWNRHGATAFIFEILEIVAPDERIMREQVYLDIAKPAYNSCPVAGKTEGWKHSQESIEKMRRVQSCRKPFKLTPEQAHKISLAKKGKPRPQSVKDALRKAKLGKKLSPETCAKMSAGQKLRNQSPERQRQLKEQVQRMHEKRQAILAARPPKTIKPRRQATDLTGVRFNQMVVVGFSHKEGLRRWWEVRCDCGTVKLMTLGAGVMAATKSCGCWRRARIIAFNSPPVNR